MIFRVGRPFAARHPESFVGRTAYRDRLGVLFQTSASKVILPENIYFDLHSRKIVNIFIQSVTKGGSCVSKKREKTQRRHGASHSRKSMPAIFRRSSEPQTGKTAFPWNTRQLRRPPIQRCPMDYWTFP